MEGGGVGAAGRGEGRIFSHEIPSLSLPPSLGREEVPETRVPAARKSNGGYLTIFFYLFTLSLQLFTYSFIYLLTSLSICLFIYISIYLFTDLSFYLLSCKRQYTAFLSKAITNVILNIDSLMLFGIC